MVVTRSKALMSDMFKNFTFIRLIGKVSKPKNKLHRKRNSDTVYLANAVYFA